MSRCNSEMMQDRDIVTMEYRTLIEFQFALYRMVGISSNLECPLTASNHSISVTSRHCTKTAEQMELAFWHRGFHWLILISKNKGTSLWNFVLNSGLRKFRNYTSMLSGVVNLGGRSVWQTGNGRRSPVHHTDRFSGSGDLLVFFLLSGTTSVQHWAPECPKVKIKNGRLANLASNPIVTVPILELWTKMGYKLTQYHSVWRKNDKRTCYINIVLCIQGWPKKLNPYCFSTNCATSCANKARFVRLECNTRITTLIF